MADAHLPVRVQRLEPDRFAVTVGERTRHEVTAERWALDRAGRPGEQPEQTLERAFRFLLQREPPESIMRSFRLEEIADYFPDFWERMA